MCKISFIIPVYNTSQYITKCVDSILNQNIHSYEIIIIDDGSTDDSLKVLQKYSRQKQITIISQTNGGVSSARNKGIEICNGDYIFFVDSDDYIEYNSMGYVLKIIQKENPDLLRLSSNIIINNKKKIEKTKWEGYKTIDTLYSNSQFCPTLWGYIFKTSIIKAHKISFNEKLKYSEDSNFIFKYINHTNKIFFLNKITYNYLIRSNSAIHQNFTLNWAESNLIALVDILLMFQGNKQNNIKFIINYYLRSYFVMIFKAKLIYSNDAKESYKRYFQQIYQLSKDNLTTQAKLSQNFYLLVCFINCFVFYYYRFKSKYLN